MAGGKNFNTPNMFSHIIKDKYLRVVAVLSLLLLLIAGIVFYATAGAEPKPLTIHFKPSSGVDFSGTRGDVFGVLFSAFAIITINIFLADFLYNRKRFLSYIFSFANLWFAILILVTIGVIISIN